MRMLGIIVPGELAVLVYGAGADRVAPDWIPTWALFVSATLFAGVAAWVYFSGVKKDREKEEKAASDIKTAFREQLREELDARDVQVRSLKEVAAKLPQEKLVGGHTYARLPPGAYIVTMADGSGCRIALSPRVRHTVSVDLKGNVDDA